HETLSDHLFGAPGRWSVRRCTEPGCGLGWVDPKPRADQIGKLYAGYYTHQANGLGPPRSYATTGARHIAKRVLATVFFWKSAAYRTDYFHLEGMKPGRLLEVGCGNGDFLRAAAAAGWDALGIDFDAEAVAAARSHPGVRAEVGDLLDHHFPNGSFDAIVMNNLIEHLDDPLAEIAECHRLLRPGGRLVVITPNLDSMGHAIFGGDWRGLEPPRHLHLFSVPTLRRAARNSGYRHITAFSTPGGEACRGIMQGSIEIARKCGHRHDESPAEISRRERLMVTLGRPCGEWAVLVATA
ncbi:MAG: class I SAM-dependent methyltransferase, partial [Sphingomonadaceae bacterium]